MIASGLALTMFGVLIIAQVTAGQALQRLGVLGGSSGGGTGGQVGAVGTGIGIGLTGGA